MRFLENNGIGGVPGTELYNSGPFELAGGGYNTVSITGLSDVNVPDIFTWTLSVSGLDSGAGEKVGLLVYASPSVGSSPNDFWINQANVWTLNQLNGGATVANFSARVVAVPEPGTIALLALGGIGLLAVRRRN